MEFNTTTTEQMACFDNVILPGKSGRITKTINFYSTASGIKSCAITYISGQVLGKKIHPFANNNIPVTQAMYLILFYTWDTLPIHEINLFNNLHSTGILTAIAGNSKIQKSNNELLVTNFSPNVQNTYQAMGISLKTATAENADALLYRRFAL